MEAKWENYLKEICWLEHYLKSPSNSLSSYQNIEVIVKSHIDPDDNF